jgi:hypothetical protein
VGLFSRKGEKQKTKDKRQKTFSRKERKDAKENKNNKTYKKMIAGCFNVYEGAPRHRMAKES